jgi:hypothetical protein
MYLLSLYNQLQHKSFKLVQIHHYLDIYNYNVILGGKN